jgi:hypothetical protein
MMSPLKPPTHPQYNHLDEPGNLGQAVSDFHPCPVHEPTALGQPSGNRAGFQNLIDAGLPEFTFEAVILNFSERFPADVVEACRHSLAKAGAKI